MLKNIEKLGMGLRTRLCTCMLYVYVFRVQVMKPGGVLLFRDYGLYDHAMLRFGRGHKIADNFYVRQDGTRAYYFSEGNVHLCVQEHRHLYWRYHFEGRTTFKNLYAKE